MKIKKLALHKKKFGISDKYEKYMTIDDSGEQRKLFLLKKSSKEMRKIETDFTAFYSAVLKLTQYIIRHEPELKDLFNRHGLDVEALQKRSPESYITYARIDTVFSKNEYKIFEFNCRRPQMFEDADWFGRYLNDQGSIVDVENNSHEIADSILQQYIVEHHKEPEGVIMITSHTKPEIPFSFYNTCKSVFKDAYFEAVPAREYRKFFESLSYSNNSLFYMHKKVDLIIVQNLCGNKTNFYSRSGAVKNIHIAEAFHAGAVEIANSPATLLAGSKTMLDLLLDSEYQKKAGLNTQEIHSIRLIPRSVSYQHIKNFGEYYDNLYVIKMTGKSGGKGIILPSELDKETWLDKTESMSNLQQNFILQEYVAPQEDEIILLDTMKTSRAFTTLEPILIYNPSKKDPITISGFSARAIKVEDFSPTTKFNPAYGRKELYFGFVGEDSI